MKKNLSSITVLIILLITDTLISIILGVLYSVFESKGIYKGKIEIIISDFVFAGIMRLFLYLIICFPLFIWINGKFKFSSKLLQLIVLNCGLYILISLFYGLILPPTRDYFITSFFYIIIVSTILSPLILNSIPYFKKLINEVMIIKS